MSEGKSAFSEYMNIKPLQMGPGPQLIDPAPPVLNTNIGLHLDEGKSQVDGIDPQFMLAVGEILEYGARKYAKYNWTKGIDYSRIYGSLVRHMLRWYAGEDIDPESGKPHLWHAACNLAFLISYTAREGYEDFDDRPWRKEAQELRKSQAVERKKTSGEPRTR